MTSDFGSLPESTPIPSASIEESPEPTTDKTEPAPSNTSDQSEDETESGLVLDTTDGIGFHPPETKAPAPEEPAQEPAEETPAPPVRQGWCCSGGEVSLSSEQECKDRQGGFFLRQRPALAACLITGCCVDGGFKLGEKRERCDELGGTYMAAIEVPFRCKAP